MANSFNNQDFFNLTNEEVSKAYEILADMNFKLVMDEIHQKRYGGLCSQLDKVIGDYNEARKLTDNIKKKEQCSKQIKKSIALKEFLVAILNQRS